MSLFAPSNPVRPSPWTLPSPPEAPVQVGQTAGSLPVVYTPPGTTTTTSGTTTSSTSAAGLPAPNRAFWQVNHPAFFPAQGGKGGSMKSRALILLGLLLLGVMAFGQTLDSTVHVASFPGLTVGQKIGFAQSHCPAAVGVPCILVIDPSLNAFALGTVPALCSTCYIVDYRSGGASFGLWQALDAYAQGGADSGGLVNVFQTNPGDYAASLPVTTSITASNYGDGAGVRASVLVEGASNTAAGIVGRGYNSGVNTLVSAFRSWVENDAGNPTEIEAYEVPSPAFYVGNPVTAEAIHVRKWGASGALHNYAIHIDDQGTAAADYALGIDGGNSYINGTLNLNGTPAASRWSTSTASLGGSALTAGACSTTNVAVSGIGNPDVVIVSPRTYPGAGFWWDGYILSAGTAQVRVCAAVAGTPTASVYDVKILP